MSSYQFPHMRVMFPMDQEETGYKRSHCPAGAGPSALEGWPCSNWALALLFPSPLSEDQLPPGFPNIDMGPQLKVVERTRTATMLCAASGNPDPEITWFKDFLPVDPSASNGRIKQLRSGECRWLGRCGSHRGQHGEGTLSSTQALGASGRQKGRADVQPRRPWVLGEVYIQR